MTPTILLRSFLTRVDYRWANLTPPTIEQAIRVFDPPAASIIIGVMEPGRTWIDIYWDQELGSQGILNMACSYMLRL